MTREVEILNLLLDKYERSGHCLPAKVSNRSVALDMTRGNYPDYRENDPAVTEINKVIQTLENEHLVIICWRSGYEGWLIDKVKLNLDLLEYAYRKVGRTPISNTANQLARILYQASSQFHTPWKAHFALDEAKRIESKLRPSRLLPEDIQQVEAIMKVLQFTEKGPELIRVVSTNCFSDSKYLEDNLISKLISIAKAYEPELVAYCAYDNELLTKSVVLEHLGLLVYPEIYELCGSANLVFTKSPVNIETFESGFCLQSDNLRYLEEIELSDIETLLFIENRANYRSAVLQGVNRDTLIVYHGGFYSPTKRRFFALLAKGIAPTTKTMFWGDIDLGGFVMYTRLKRDAFPNLVPYKMGLADFEKYKNRGKKKQVMYLDLLDKRMKEKQFDDMFLPVARAIITEEVTVEQEIML